MPAPTRFAMANKMLIDATHPEETRVVVLRGNRVEEFDFETAQRKQLRGNIYLAKVTRVEPSLQAAFVDYGGNRHGFLAFSEIHPDYYQIPVADRQALIDEEGRAQRAADDEDDRRSRRHRGRGRPHQARRDSEVVRGELAETSPEAAADGDESGFTHTASDSDHHSGEHAGTAEHEVADHETGAPEAAGSQASFEPQTPPELPPPIPAEAFSGESGQSVSGDSHRAAHEAAAPGEDNPESAEAAPHAGGEGDTAEHGSHEDAHGETAAASGHHELSPHETAEGEGAENGEDDEAAEEIVELVGGSNGPLFRGSIVGRAGLWRIRCSRRRRWQIVGVSDRRQSPQHQCEPTAAGQAAECGYITDQSPAVIRSGTSRKHCHRVSIQAAGRANTSDGRRLCQNKDITGAARQCIGAEGRGSPSSPHGAGPRAGAGGTESLTAPQALTWPRNFAGRRSPHRERKPSSTDSHPPDGTRTGGCEG